MQIMFTRLMPLWSVGGRQSQRGAVLSQARPDPLLTPCWAPSSPLGSSVCCRVRQARGLCAAFAVADFQSICGEKIGLVYHLSFIVLILFVIPTNYIFSRYPLLSSAHANRKKTKTECYSENQIQQSTHWHNHSGL